MSITLHSHLGFPLLFHGSSLADMFSFSDDICKEVCETCKPIFVP